MENRSTLFSTLSQLNKNLFLLRKVSKGAVSRVIMGLFASSAKFDGMFLQICVIKLLLLHTLTNLVHLVSNSRWHDVFFGIFGSGTSF